MNRTMMWPGLVFAALAAGSSAHAGIVTAPTTDPTTLAAALRPRGLTIESVFVRSGMPGQIGTYHGFAVPPVTIRDGILLSSGDVADLSPLAEAQQPDYNPASPPARVSSQMVADPDTGGTSEFDAYGLTHGTIANFTASYDVASLEVTFNLPAPSSVKFDFIFGSVEFPFWTSQYTDAFVVFLDGLTPADQVTFDNHNDPVQVGVSFADLTQTNDVNTAFAAPHGLVTHLTTTTPVLEEGEHTLRFGVGDVNDHVLDSVVFITGLRAEPGTPGTDGSDDCRADFDSSGTLTPADIFAFLTAYFSHEHDADFDGDGTLAPTDIFTFLSAFFARCPVGS